VLLHAAKLRPAPNETLNFSVASAANSEAGTMLRLTLRVAARRVERAGYADSGWLDRRRCVALRERAYASLLQLGVGLRSTAVKHAVHGSDRSATQSAYWSSLCAEGGWVAVRRRRLAISLRGLTPRAAVL